MQRPTGSVATIPFTDIVGSADKDAAMGDEAWGKLLEQHHRRTSEATRRQVAVPARPSASAFALAALRYWT